MERNGQVAGFTCDRLRERPALARTAADQGDKDPLFPGGEGEVVGRVMISLFDYFYKRSIAQTNCTCFYLF